MTAAVAAGIYADPAAAVAAMVPPVRTVMPDTAKAEIYDKKYARYVRLTTCLEGF